jgi:hypothetical protein
VAMVDWGWAIRAGICKLHPPSWTYLTLDTLLIQCVFVCYSFCFVVFGRCRFPEKVTRPARIKYHHVSAGEAHNAIVATSGALYTFGNGSHGRLGHGIEESCNVPTAVDTLQRVRNCCLSGTAVCQGLRYGAMD